MRKSKNKGFTLVELMIVVVVIGIVAGMGGSSYMRARKQAEFNNVFNSVVGVIQKARTMAINSQRISDKTPDYFETDFYPLLASPDEISIAGTDNENIIKQFSEYNTSINDNYDLIFSNIVDMDGNNLLTVVDKTIYKIKFFAPFGDAKLSIFNMNNNSDTEIPKITITLKNIETSQEKSFSINKISGVINYE